MRFLWFLIYTLCFFSCKSQTPDVSQRFDKDYDEEMPFYVGMPTAVKSVDYSPAWKDPKGKQIVLTGTVYKADGKSVAANVLLYYYQTDVNGRYTHKPEEVRSLTPNGLGQTHGYIRGWVKTDAQGKYRIYTIQPGVYPSRAEPAHIHLNIKEPDGGAPYYVDDFYFDNDPLLTAELRKKMPERAGNGVIRFVEKNGLLYGERDLILGLNIPDYPNKNADLDGGKQPGESLHSFTPSHAWGPDKGTKTCPICKYGWYHGVLYFVGNKPNWIEIEQWLKLLEQESTARNPYLKVYFIYGNETDYLRDRSLKLLEHLGARLQLTQVALTYVPSFKDKESDIYLNQIDPDVSTILLYKRSKITAKLINPAPTAENVQRLGDFLKAAENEYFALPPADH